jgi:hypothetical protein
VDSKVAYCAVSPQVGADFGDVANMTACLGECFLLVSLITCEDILGVFDSLTLAHNKASQI